MGEALENIGVGDAVVACAAEVDFVIDLEDEVFLLEDLGFEGVDFGKDGGKFLGAPGLEEGAIFVEKLLPVSVCGMESGCLVFALGEQGLAGNRLIENDEFPGGNWWGWEFLVGREWFFFLAKFHRGRSTSR